MVSFQLPKELIKMLDFVEGETTEKKVISLVNGNVSLKLKECEDAIVKFESKYGMTFKDFKIAWAKGKIPKKYSHEAERDYMEWEGFEEEKEHWLSNLRKIKVMYLSKG